MLWGNSVVSCSFAPPPDSAPWSDVHPTGLQAASESTRLIEWLAELIHLPRPVPAESEAVPTSSVDPSHLHDSALNYRDLTLWKPGWSGPNSSCPFLAA